MIIIPIHIFFDDRPTNIPKILDEKYFGIKRRNIQNAINGKTVLNEESKKNAYKKLSSLCDDIPGVMMVASEKEFLDSISDLNKIKFLDCIQDDYCRYFRQTIKEIFELDIHLETEVEKIKSQPPARQIDNFRNLISNSEFPGTMFEDNLFDDTDDEVQNIQITLRKIMVDSLFYILAAYDVEYNHHFLKSQNGDKPFFLRYLPSYEGDILQNPSKLWLERLQKLNEYKTITEFATAIPQLGVPPKDTNIESQKKMLRKWKTGKDKQLPSWENINSIVKTIVKKRNINMDNLELYQEQGRFGYAHIKIFQILLNRLMVENNKELFGMNNVEVIEFFERYLYWHNYHSVLFMEYGH